MSEEQKDWSEENKKRMLVALAIFLGASIENKVESYSKIGKDILAKAEDIYESKGMKNYVEQQARMPEQQV